VNTLYCI